MAVVVITGCSSGFGQKAAKRFGARGDRVWATMRRPGDGDDQSTIRRCAAICGPDAEMLVQGYRTMPSAEFPAIGKALMGL